jgi:hypothetical protein
MDVTQSQPKSAAERQAAHRARQRQTYSHRVNTWLPEDAGRALKRLARHHGISQAELIARLVLAEEESLAAGIADDQLDRYYHGRASQG